jgi:hypothetical protein
MRSDINWDHLLAAWILISFLGAKIRHGTRAEAAPALKDQLLKQT